MGGREGGKGGEREGKRGKRKRRGKGREGKGKDPHCFLDKSNTCNLNSTFMQQKCKKKQNIRQK